MNKTEVQNCLLVDGKYYHEGDFIEVEISNNEKIAGILGEMNYFDDEEDDDCIMLYISGTEERSVLLADVLSVKHVG